MQSLQPKQPCRRYANMLPFDSRHFTSAVSISDSYRPASDSSFIFSLTWPKISLVFSLSLTF